MQVEAHVMQELVPPLDILSSPSDIYIKLPGYLNGQDALEGWWLERRRR